MAFGSFRTPRKTRSHPAQQKGRVHECHSSFIHHYSSGGGRRPGRLLTRNRSTGRSCPVQLATEASVVSGSVVGLPASLGDPAGKTAASSFQSGTASEAQWANFVDLGTYSSSGLASLLGVSTAVVDNADTILFEVNGTGGGPFETSVLTFDDGTNSVSYAHDFTAPATTFPDGILSGGGQADTALFNAFFGSAFPQVSVAFLLFDFGGAVDATNPGFTVNVFADGGIPGVDPGSPDIFGVATLVPEPNSMLLGISAVGCWWPFASAGRPGSTAEPSGFAAAGVISSLGPRIADFHSVGAVPPRATAAWKSARAGSNVPGANAAGQPFNIRSAVLAFPCFENDQRLQGDPVMRMFQKLSPLLFFVAVAFTSSAALAVPVFNDGTTNWVGEIQVNHLPATCTTATPSSIFRRATTGPT